MFSRQLRLGWFRSPIISTCEKPRLFAFFSVSFIFASFVTLLFGDLQMQPISNLSFFISLASHHTLSSPFVPVSPLYSVIPRDSCV